MGLVGGAGSGFIGRVHVTAATLDGRAELVAGALSSQPDRARAAAAEFGLDPRRAYGDYRELFAAESQLPADERIDFVTIATPNDTHFAVARAALQAGLHVVCEKPLTIDADQAEALVRQVEASRSRVHDGLWVLGLSAGAASPGDDPRRRVGRVQAVRVHYLQGGLWSLQPGQPPARAAWKADPARAGPAGTFSDIGTHAYHLVRFLTGLPPRDVSCQLRNFHPARPLDDYGVAVLRFANGALGTITVSQVTQGQLNDLGFEVDGTRASLAWRQQAAEQLLVRRHGQPLAVYERQPRAAYLSAAGRSACRLPGGHPEGFFEALANLYRESLAAMADRAAGQVAAEAEHLYPDVYDGWEGVWFVRQGVASSRADGAWQPLPPRPKSEPANDRFLPHL